MKKIKTFFLNLVYGIKIVNHIISITIKSYLSKRKLFLLGIPYHGNLGDQAIAVAEEKFLKDKFGDCKVININTHHVIRFPRLFSKIIGKDTILYTGGGFLGSIWLNEEEMFRAILKMFPNNRVVALPQTFYFSDDNDGKEVLKDSIKYYSNHKDLHLICRENFSYDFMKKHFKLNNVYLAPDMVLYLDNISENYNRKGVLVCVRQDKEKVNHNFEDAINLLNEKFNNISYSGTVINKNVFPDKRSSLVYKKIQEFSNYELVITDRLHGMIFALLSNTPCIVFTNKSYKIKGVYEWIKTCDYVKLVEEIDFKIIDNIIKSNKSYKFDKRNFEIIENIISGDKKSES